MRALSGRTGYARLVATALGCREQEGVSRHQLRESQSPARRAERGAGGPPAGQVRPSSAQEAAQALLESRRRYGTLFSQMLEGVAYCQLLIDEAGQPADWLYLEVNPAFEALTGLHGAAGRLVTQLIPGVRETNPELFEIYGRVVRTGDPEQFETYLPALDRWFLVKVYRPQAGHFAAVFENVTESRRVKEALQASETLLRGSLDALADPFMICSPVRDTRGAIVDFRIAFSNRAGGAFIGRTPESLVGGPLPDRMPNLRGRAYRDVFRDVVETGQPYLEDCVEFVVPGPDGTDVLRLVDIEVAAFGDGLFAAGRDVTEREKLARERDRLAAAVEQSIESIVVTDLDARIVYVNPAFERMTGYTAVRGHRTEPALPEERPPAALVLYGHVGCARQRFTLDGRFRQPAQGRHFLLGGDRHLAGPRPFR